MQDLRSRWNVLISLLVLAATFGVKPAVAAPVLRFHSPALAASNSTMQFGSVAVGSTKNLTDYIFNPSNSSVTIHSATVSGADFQVSQPSFPVTVGPRQRIRLVVTFTPHAAGPSADSVVISSTAIAPTMTLSVAGDGAAPGSPVGQTTGAQITPVPSSVSFGSVAMGSTQSQAAGLINSGSTSLLIEQVVGSSSDFVVSGLRLPVVLSPGGSLNFSVIFSPKASGARTGAVSITGSASLGRRSFGRRGASVSAAITLDGVGGSSGNGTTVGALTSNPTSLNFGTPAIQSSQTKPLVLTNSGTASITINSAVAAGAGYSLTGPALPLSLAGGQTATFSVVFVPSTTAAGAGSINVTSTASNPALSVPLSATVSAPGSLASSSPVAFGNVTVGSSQQKTATITNSGGSAVTISSATVSGTGFTMGAMSMPMTLAPSQSANISITCAPQTAGSLSGNLIVNSNATNATLTVPLSVTAVAAGSLTGTSAVAFGNVTIGSSQQKTATITNSGGSTVTISTATVSGTGFTMAAISTPLTLAPSQSANITITSAPKTAGSLSGNLVVNSNATNATLTIPLSGTAVAPGSLASSSVAFGNVSVGSSQQKTATITNSGGSTVTISSATVSGTGFTMGTIATPLTVGPNQSASITITCAPKTAGPLSGSLLVNSDATDATLTVPLSVTAIAPGTLTIAPTAFSFGSVQSGSSQTLPGTLTNTGGTTVTVSQAAFSGAGTGYSLTGLTLPLTLAAGQSASFNVVFAPQAAGTDNFNLSITSNATNAALTATVSGSAAAPGVLSASAPSLSFGSVTVNTSKSLPETVTNSGGSSITLSQSAAGAGYSVTGLTLPQTLAAGKSVSFTVVFAPQTAVSSSVSLAITTSNPSSTLSIPLSGTGVTSGALSSSAVSFGSVQVGKTGDQTATVKNTGGASVTISSAKVTGSQFGMSGLSVPMTLAAGQSFTFDVSFMPTTAGSASGSIAFVSDAASSPTIALSGTATAAGQLSVSPTSFAFGSLAVNTSKSLPVTLTASGGSVTVTSASVNSAEFALTGPAVPLTIAAGSTASFTLTFDPQSSGTASASVSFSTSASTSPITEAATGTGTAAPQPHRVELSWSPSSSAVMGYNVYRGSKTGGPYTKLVPTPDTTTSFSDTTVQAGQTYFYVTTAVANDGTESSFSNQVTAAIPTP